MVPAAPVFEFGPFRFEPGERRLLRDGAPLPLGPKALELLLVLLERRGSLVTRRELLDRVWAGCFVEENSLTKCVSALRRTLDDTRARPQYIETVATCGYRFVGDVHGALSSPMADVLPLRLRVTVQLLDAGRPLWSEVREMAVCAGPRRRPTRDAHAYRLYREARCHVLRYTEAGWRKGVASYELAIAQDPEFALAHADLAIASALASVYYTGSVAVRERAREAARRALEADPLLAEAHLASAIVRFLLDWNWDGAEHEFHAALALNPQQAWVHDYYGFFLTLMGRFGEARPELERALELHPVRLAINGDLGLHHYYAGDVEQSLAHHRRALELDPYAGLTRVQLARTWERSGRPADAAAELEATLPFDDTPWVRLWLARAYALMGRPDPARRTLAAMPNPTFRALIHAALGEHTDALTLLEDARTQRSPWMAFLRTEPAFAELRDEPRFRRLARQIGL